MSDIVLTFYSEDEFEISELVGEDKAVEDYIDDGYPYDDIYSAFLYSKEQKDIAKVVSECGEARVVLKDVTVYVAPARRTPMGYEYPYAGLDWEDVEISGIKRVTADELRAISDAEPILDNAEHVKMRSDEV
jgi:hypothetical protein